MSEQKLSKSIGRRILPAIVSYAQNFEDVMLRRALQDVENGFYVDLGAWHPVSDNVSFWFYQNGWSGINVEPNPQVFALLASARPRDTNLQVAIAGRPGVVRLYIYEGLSTIQRAIAAGHQRSGIDMSKTIEVSAITLDHLFEQHVGINTIDFLKIDVEGSEAEILSATSFETVRPRILVVEATRPSSPEPNWQRWEPGLIKKGYLWVWFDGLNRFYVREEDRWRRELFETPPNVFDSIRFSARDHRIDGGGENASSAEALRNNFERALVSAEREIAKLRTTFSPKPLASGSALAVFVSSISGLRGGLRSDRPATGKSAPTQSEPRVSASGPQPSTADLRDQLAAVDERLALTLDRIANLEV
jgi:FkbM family methyltransferase